MKPIIFNTEMVRAILDGRKTQTRRIVSKKWLTLVEKVLEANGKWVWDTADAELTTPYGRPGDILWVRETVCIPPVNWADKTQECIRDDSGNWRHIAYRADASCEDGMHDYGLKWTPSIHMPKWAAQIFLRVTDLRVERLQNITEADGQAEGIERISLGPDEIDGVQVHPMTSTYRAAFSAAWDAIYSKRGFGWQNNPWVWVAEFQREMIERCQ
jgi:hypothetical protein